MEFEAPNCDMLCQGVALAATRKLLDFLAINI